MLQNINKMFVVLTSHHWPLLCRLKAQVGNRIDSFHRARERERERGQFRFISFQFDRKSNAMSNNEHKKTERKLFGSLWSCSSTKTRINIHQFHGQPTCNILRAAKLMVLRCNEISDSKLFAICVFVYVCWFAFDCSNY